VHDPTARKGAQPSSIDGGYEFNGSLRSQADGPAEGMDKSGWWVKDDTDVFSLGPIAGYRQGATYPFSRWLFQPPAAIVVLQREKNARNERAK
jgi:hypothetical protein